MLPGGTQTRLYKRHLDPTLVPEVQAASRSDQQGVPLVSTKNCGDHGVLRLSQLTTSLSGSGIQTSWLQECAFVSEVGMTRWPRASAPLSSRQVGVGDSGCGPGAALPSPRAAAAASALLGPQGPQSELCGKLRFSAPSVCPRARPCRSVWVQAPASPPPRGDSESSSAQGVGLRGRACARLASSTVGVPWAPGETPAAPGMPSGVLIGLPSSTLSPAHFCPPLTRLSSPLSPGVGPRLCSPRQLRRGNPQTVHATKDHTGQPQGPHILFRK